MNKALAELLFPSINSENKNDRNYFESKRVELIKSRELSESAEVTRTGPSPTGPMHIGTLYAALVSRSIAKQSGGLFYLRIEDTDKAREVEGARAIIEDTLQKYDLNYDEEYVQSERVDIYKAFTYDLLERGLAYPCFLSEVELDKLREEQIAMKIRPGVYGKYATHRDLSIAEVEEKIKSGETYVIRFRASGDVNVKSAFVDKFLGDHNIPGNDEDFPLLKSNGIPTYHWAHVVDDYTLGTTFVTRGEEWLSSLGKHLDLWKAINAKAPKYGHFMPINKKEGNTVRKLSKRKDPEANMKYWEEIGYTKEAILFYLLRLANPNLDEWWGKLQKENQKINFDDYVLDLEQMKRGSRGPLLDTMKLDSMSSDLIANMSAEEVTEHVLGWTEKYDIELNNIIKIDVSYLKKVLNIERETQEKRKDITKWSDVKEVISYFYDEPYDKESRSIKFTDEERTALVKILDKLKLEENSDIFDCSLSVEDWIGKIKSIYADMNIENLKFGNFMMLIRRRVTNKERTPNLYYVFEVLGRDKVLARLKI